MCVGVEINEQAKLRAPSARTAKASKRFEQTPHPCSIKFGEADSRIKDREDIELAISSTINNVYVVTISI